jgi:transposase
MENYDGRKEKRDALEAFRKRAVTLRYQKGYSVSQISEIFGIHYNSVSRWFVNYRKGGIRALQKRKAPGAELKIDPEQMNWLYEALSIDATHYGFPTPLWTCDSVRKLITKELNIKIDRVTTWRYLIRMGLSDQKPETRYSQQDEELVRQWITKEWPNIQKWAKKKRAILYFEDESGVSLIPAVGKTWAPKGKTPVIRITGSRGGVLAMSAISPAGRMCFCIEKRKINADVLIEFLSKIKETHKRRTIGIIMDQAPCHKAKKVREFAEKSKRMKIFYIPPYSPELNPDEKVWRHLKHVSLKNHQAKDKRSLTRLVRKALKSIQNDPELTSHFFINYLT